MITEAKWSNYSGKEKVAYEYISLCVFSALTAEDIIEALSKYRDYRFDMVDEDCLVFYNTRPPTQEELNEAKEFEDKGKAIRHRQYLQLKKEFEPNAKA